MVSLTKDISELLPRSGMHESCACCLWGKGIYVFSQFPSNYGATDFLRMGMAGAAERVGPSLLPQKSGKAQQMSDTSRLAMKFATVSVAGHLLTL